MSVRRNAIFVPFLRRGDLFLFLGVELLMGACASKERALEFVCYFVFPFCGDKRNAIARRRERWTVVILSMVTYFIFLTVVLDFVRVN